MNGSRTTPIDFDADLLAELRAEEPGKGDRELLEDLAIRRRHKVIIGRPLGLLCDCGERGESASLHGRQSTITGDELRMTATDANGTTKQAIAAANADIPLSAAVIGEGRFLHVSGQVAERDGELVTGTIEEETELVLENLAAVLAQAGASPADVVRCGVYLANLDDFAAMNAVYARVFPDPKPARTTVGTALLFGLKVEIDCVAVLPAKG